MATLPQAIQRQVEAAESMLTGAPQPAETPQTPEHTPPEAQQEPTAQPTAPTPEPSPAPPQQPQDAWQQKYQILQGKYNAEVPQLHHQVKDLTRKLTETSERMDQLARTQETKQAEQKVAADPKDVDAFGADLVDMVQRMTQQALSGVTAKMDGFLNGLNQRVAFVEQKLQGTSETVAYTAEQTFFAQLSKAAPNWEQTNADPRFLTWLGEVDPLLGTSRQAALDAAQKTLDSVRVAAIFKAFEATLPKPSVKPASNLNKQISPSAAASSEPAPSEKKVFTQQEVKAFYKDLALGKYRGQDDVVAKTEAAINLAMQEGRIR